MMESMSDYIEVQVENAEDAGEILGMLPDEGILGAWEDEGILRIYWKVDQWTPAALLDVKQIVMRSSPRADLKVLPVEERDWNARWVESIQPIRIGKRFRIRQSWAAPDPSFQGIEFVIDPRRAFGSGYHASTQLLIEWMETRVQPGVRVLDLGTGSGILAMVALKLGAAFALGIDNDPVAIECAVENARANGFGPELELRVGAASDRHDQFGLVVANLDRRTLLEICNELPEMLPDSATALVSGLLIADVDELTEAFGEAGAAVIERRERDEWAALEIRRAS